MKDRPSVRDACDEGEHSIVENEDGYKVCERCGLSVQAIQNWLSHSV